MFYSNFISSYANRFGVMPFYAFPMLNRERVSVNEPFVQRKYISKKAFFASIEFVHLLLVYFDLVL